MASLVEDIVEISSPTDKNTCLDGDSGRWSFETDQTEKEEEIMEDIIVASEIPTPPPLPPDSPQGILNILPGASISDVAFRDTFGSPSSINCELHVGTFPGRHLECPICYESRPDVSKLDCCKANICRQCLTSFIEINIIEGRVYIPCPLNGCDKPLKRDFISHHITEDDLRLKYERFRLNYEGDGTKKTCPNCCLITQKDLSSVAGVSRKNKSKQVILPVEYKVCCQGCQFDWCFNCHSPWHEGLSCEAYKAGDKQFKHWTKVRHTGFVPNCQKCPKCKVFIERTEGCDHMQCNRCHTHFCYKCGGQYISYPLLGDHYQRMSVLGCPYNFNPDKPAERRFIRGGFLFAKGAAMTGYPVRIVCWCMWYNYCRCSCSVACSWRHGLVSLC